jgi:hypothetical protein
MLRSVSGKLTMWFVHDRGAKDSQPQRVPHLPCVRFIIRIPLRCSNSEREYSIEKSRRVVSQVWFKDILHILTSEENVPDRQVNLGRGHEGQTGFTKPCSSLSVVLLPGIF